MTGWCTTLTLDNSESYIKTLEIGYDSKGLTHLALMSTEEFIIFGQQVYSFDSKKAKVSFSEEE